MAKDDGRSPDAWRPIKTAPFQTVIEVRNPQMQEPCLATRGYAHNGMVHPDNTFCTSVFTPRKFFSTPSGQLVCPTEWRPSSKDTPMTVEVTQADRDAANKAFDIAFRGDTNGIDDAMAGLLAAHRLAHTVDATDGEREAKPGGDAGDAIDFALGHINEADAAIRFLDDWRGDFSHRWPDYHRWLAVQRKGARQARQPAAEADEVGRLREALRPFAEKADKREAYVRKTHPNYNEPDSMQVTHRLGDFRAARTALNRADNAEGGLDLLDEGAGEGAKAG